MHHCTDGAHGTYDDTRLDRFRPHAGALDLLWAYLDGFAVILLLALVDGDVIHPHRVLLRYWRDVRQAHGIAVVQKLARAARCRCRLLGARLERHLFVLINGEVVATAGILPGGGRIIGRAARIAVVKNFAFRRCRSVLGRDSGREHAGS